MNRRKNNCGKMACRVAKHCSVSTRASRSLSAEIFTASERYFPIESLFLKYRPLKRPEKTSKRSARSSKIRYGTRSDTTSAGATTSSTSVKTRGKISRSEEHTSELQSQFPLVCHLLLSKIL